MPADMVHVVDDDEAVRDSLSFLLMTAGLNVQTYESATAFLATAESLAGGCIISDVRMPGLSGLDLIRALKTREETTPVIIITGHGDVPMAVEAMKIGAADFLEKPFDDGTLLAAIRNALDRAHAEDAQNEESNAIRERLASLSQRERQVLDRLVTGQANKVIAFELDISPRTVEVYRANVMTKMQAGSLSELVRMALAAERH
jgi:two-component system response regulator FixJ